MLFEPVKIGKMECKNRIAMAPMGIMGLINPDGSPAQRAVDYYIERARGGVGLIITALFKVENEIDALKDIAGIGTAVLAPFGELSEAVHALGTKIFVQLTAGFGRTARLTWLRDKPVSSSAVPHYWEPDILCRPLTVEEVEKIVQAFGTAAEIVAAAGIDGVELHGHEGYLLDQFTTALWNRRTDKYGGDLRGRLTFPIKALREIKQRVGADFPVQYRYGLKHYMKGLNQGALKNEEYVEAGRDIGEGLEMAKLLEEAGFDALHVDAGCYDSWYWPHPPTYQEYGCMVDMAAMVKEVVNIPVIAVGRLEVPELAEQVLQEGKADIIALGRGLLADPNWPMKTRDSATDDIRPCIGCHDGCMGRFPTRRPLSCAVNPACGRERLYQLVRAEKPKKVMVVGGGVAGMEAARVTAIRGHKVTLYEKGKSLGGHLIEASVPEFKESLRKLLRWYEGQLKKLDVEIILETEVSMPLVDRENLDILFVATGSTIAMPDIPGVERSNVATCIDILLGKRNCGEKVLIAGGGLTGCEVALWLAEQKKEVTIVEMLPGLMDDGIPVPHMNKVLLLDLLSANNVNVIANASIREITDDGAIIESGTAQKRAIKADTVVLAMGLKSDNKLYDELRGKVAQIYALGDCVQPRNIMGAIWDAYQVGQAV
ncbi:FAD-dependent oxidoreductase [Chloroflexota bacterium]